MAGARNNSQPSILSSHPALPMPLPLRGRKNLVSVSESRDPRVAVCAVSCVMCRVVYGI